MYIPIVRLFVLYNKVSEIRLPTRISELIHENPYSAAPRSLSPAVAVQTIIIIIYLRRNLVQRGVFVVSVCRDIGIYICRNISYVMSRK